MKLWHFFIRLCDRIDDLIDIKGYLFSIPLDNINEEVNQENSNKNPVINSTQRDYMAGEVSKDLRRESFYQMISSVLMKKESFIFMILIILHRENIIVIWSI